MSASIPGRAVQSVTCLATDVSLPADPGVARSILAQSHTFVEIDHEIISTVILLPSAESLCLPPLGSGDILFFPGRPSVCLSQIVSALQLKNRLSSIHETLYNYQSAWDDVQSARMVTLPFILLELLPFELCASQKSCPLYKLKTT